MSGVRCPAFAALLLAVACSGRGSPPAPSTTPAGPSPSSASGAGATPGVTAAPLRGSSPAPGSAPSAPSAGQPDFSGTGCFPKQPQTPFAVRVAAEDGRPVRLVLEIRATQDATVEHRHGQEFDFSVDRDGREIWRWSAVAPFVDPYGYRFTYKTGVPRTFSAVWDAKGMPDGEYRAHGFLIANMVDPPPTGRFICYDDASFRLSR